MQKMGFVPYLDELQRGFIITSFYYPNHPNFDFQGFYGRLSDKGHVIYPGKLSQAECFRIGHIGRLGLADVCALIAAIEETLKEMNVDLRERAKV
jgi:2-aminoethylphosphonate-pyruvate transaminase